MDIFLFIILLSGLLFFTTCFFRENGKETPQGQIIYKTLSENEYDKQFSEENFPSIVYNDMFTSGILTVGGFDIGYGKSGKTS